MGLPGGKRRKETLHSKASESAAHVAGFGWHLEGFSPPNLPEEFFDSLSPAGVKSLRGGNEGKSGHYQIDTRSSGARYMPSPSVIPNVV